MSPATCVRYVREALGDPEIAVEIEDVQRWSASAEYAERLREGRVFIAGDAAHVMPPTGGFGGNSGIEDGYNLAWKLAYVLDGRAGEELLATYEAERQPVGAFTTEQAYARYVLRLDPTLGTEDLVPLVGEAAVELGYRYRSAAVAGTADDDATWEDPTEPTGRPGFRAPHLPVTVGGVERSTVDLFGRRFVVLAGSAGESWRAAARAAGSALGVPVDAYRVGDGRDRPERQRSRRCTERVPKAPCSYGRTGSSPGEPPQRIPRPRRSSRARWVRPWPAPRRPSPADARSGERACVSRPGPRAPP